MEKRLADMLLQFKGTESKTVLITGCVRIRGITNGVWMDSLKLRLGTQVLTIQYMQELFDNV